MTTPATTDAAATGATSAATATDQTATDDANLGPAGEKALEQWKTRARAAEAEAKAAKALREQLKQYEDRDKTEAQKLAEAQQQAVNRADTAEARALRLEVAFEKGLTPAQAKRLAGSSREELEADADEVLRDFPSSSTETRRGAADQGVRRSNAAQTPHEAMAEWLRSQK